MPSSKFGSKFFGERYQQYVDELTAEGTIDGEKLSSVERKEGFKKRKDKVDFEKFVEKVLSKKKSAGPSMSGQKASLGGRGGAIVKTQKINPGKIVPQQVGEETKENMDEILKGIDSILNSLREQENIKEKQLKLQRRTTEKQKRKASEGKLEGGIFKGLAKATNKVLAPVKGLFERVFDFIKTVILGRVIMKLLDWMGDPDNRKKLTAIGKFLSKTWPALLFAYLAFGNGLGRFITKMLLMTLKFIPKIAMTIAKLAAAHPLAAAAIAGAGLFVAGAVIPKLMPGTVDEQERKTAAEPGTAEEKIKKLEEQKSKLNFLERMQGVGAEIDEQIKFLETGKTAAYSGGGLVQGFSGGGHALASGTDTVPAMLTPGEFVMSRGAVQKYGSGTLASMNAAGGGTNSPKMLSGSLYAQGGGHVHGAPVEDAEANRQSAEKQPKVPAGDLVSSTPSTPTVTPTEPLIPRTDKDKVAKSWKPILDLIAKYEAVGGSYDSIYPSSTKPGLSKMTIAEADSWQESTASSRGSAAAGRYQFMYIKKQAADAGIGSDKIFSPENQDKMAIALIEKKRKVTYDLMQKDPDEAMIRLGMEWAALPMPKSMQGHKRMVSAGQSYYAGDGKNKAGASVKEVRDAMKGIPPTVGRGSSSSIASDSSGGGVGSGSGGGSATEKPKMSDADQIAYARGKKGAFDYNKIREQIGTKTSSVSRSSRPSSTAAYQQQLQSQQGQQGQPSYSDEKTGKDVPQIDADAMISSQKIQVLGIVV
jgi:muramidase (phage lysozyme)